MVEQSRAWVILVPYLYTVVPLTYPVDLGGSLAVASRGLFATGVSTDLNGRELYALEITC